MKKLKKAQIFYILFVLVFSQCSNGRLGLKATSSEVIGDLKDYIVCESSSIQIEKKQRGNILEAITNIKFKFLKPFKLEKGEATLEINIMDGDGSSIKTLTFRTQTGLDVMFKDALESGNKEITISIPSNGYTEGAKNKFEKAFSDYAKAQKFNIVSKVY